MALGCLPFTSACGPHTWLGSIGTLYRVPGACKNFNGKEEENMKRHSGVRAAYTAFGWLALGALGSSIH